MARSNKRKLTDAAASTVKTIISQKPDVTVIVGDGDNKQIFECYGVLLAYASPVFDAMLSSGMKEGESKVINLPTKDPDEWRLFLECIDPASAAGYFCEDKYFEEEGRFGSIRFYNPDLEAKEKAEFLNESSIMTLVPWFHEFQMEVFLRTCDAVLYYSEIKYTNRRDSEEETRLCNLLTFSKIYNLQSVQSIARTKLSLVLSGSAIDDIYDMWDDPCDGNRIWYPIKENDGDNEVSSHVVQSYEPDLTVAIGTEEFKCHKVILSFASSTLDSLVATSSGRLEFTHMNLDSDSWEKFYTCIDPSINGATIDEAMGLDDYGLGFKTILLPWFDEFNMTKHRSIFHNKIHMDVNHLERRIENYRGMDECMPIREAIEILQVTVQHQLEGLQVKVESLLHDWIGANLLQHLLYENVKGIISLCLPIKRNTRDDEYISAGCQVLWQALNERINSHLRNLTFDNVETTEHEMFSHLVYSFIRYDRYSFDEVMNSHRRVRQNFY